MANAYETAGLNAGLSPALARYMPRFVHIESGGNPGAVTGSYTGLLQMGPDERAKYGGNSLDAGAKMYADKAAWFRKAFGRDPSPTELYLTNQQGQGGIAAHMSNPDQPAWQSMYNTPEGQQKGAAWARKAIWGNVPDDVKKQFPGGVDSLTSRDFMNLWQSKVEQGQAMPFSPFAAQQPQVTPWSPLMSVQPSPTSMPGAPGGLLSGLVNQAPQAQPQAPQAPPQSWQAALGLPSWAQPSAQPQDQSAAASPSWQQALGLPGWAQPQQQQGGGGGYMPQMPAAQQLQAPQIQYYQPRMAQQMQLPQYGPLRFS